MPTAAALRFAGLLPVLTNSVAETEALGVQVAARLQPGDVLLLFGDLGAGKTHLVRGITAGLGGDADSVTSPTFTLVHEYPSASPRVVHIDAYRLEGAEAFARIGGEELLEAEDAVTIIEWPERLGVLQPSSALAFTLRHLGGDRREVREERPGP